MNEEGLLSEGTILNGKYLVGRVLGRGGFGITYLGIELTLKIKVAIKEYFPNGISSRQMNSAQVRVQNQAANSEGFEKGKEAFQQEAETLAMFNSPSIAHVREYFLENNTAYIVMDYVGGIGLTREIRRCGGRMPWSRVVELSLPLMRELDSLHRKNLIHRDIKPDNIKIVRNEDTGEERMVLLDFGAARSFASANLTGTYTQILTPGFAPFEQYQARTHLGPYTDVYALCATMYAAITGEKPPAAPDRVMGDDGLKPLSSFGLNIPENVENAILHGLAVDYRYRPQTMAELYREFRGTTLQPSETTGIPVRITEMPAVPEPDSLPAAQTVQTHQPEVKTEGKTEAAESQKTGRKPKPFLWIIPALLAVLAAAYFLVLQPQVFDVIPKETRIALHSTETAAAEILETESALQTATQEAAEFELTQTAKVIYSNLVNAVPTETPTVTPVPVDPTKTREAMIMAETLIAGATAQAEQLLQMRSAEETATQNTVVLGLTATGEALEETLSAEATAEAIQLLQTESAVRTATQEAVDMELTATGEALAEAMSAEATVEAVQMLLTELAEKTATQEAVELGLTATGEVLAETLSAEATAKAVHVLETESAERTATQEAVAMELTQAAEQLAAVYAAQTEAARPTETYTPTPEPSATSTPSPEPTETPISALNITQTAIVLEQAAFVQTQEAMDIMKTASAWDLTKEAISLEQTQIAGTQIAIYATQTESAKPTATPTMTSTAAFTPSPSSTATLTPSLTSTRKPSATPKPTNTPKPVDLKVGDTFTFGRYEQDGNTGADPIEWQVLSIKNNRALVISKYILEAKPYHDERIDIIWAKSNVRKWLDGEFYNMVFSDKEKALIVQVDNSNPDNGKADGGNITRNKCFLLNIDEAKQYFTDDSSRQAQATYHAEQNGVNLNNNGSTWWWLRSPGNTNAEAARVRGGGDVYVYGSSVDDSSGGIRPAFWLDLSKIDDGLSINTPLIEPAVTTVPTETPKPTMTPKPTNTPKPVDLKVGDSFTFGRYEQDEKAGADPIEWQVLAVENGHALVISKYGLEAAAYHNTKVAITWENSNLRSWLNNQFYNLAFNAAEKQKIAEIVNKNENNPKYWTEGGRDTKDRIFLLSIDEAEQYIMGTEISQCELTLWAKKNEAYVNSDGFTRWWLRTPGGSSSDIAVIMDNGFIDKGGHGVNDSSYAVRPAFWLDLSGLNEEEISQVSKDMIVSSVDTFEPGEKISFVTARDD